MIKVFTPPEIYTGRAWTCDKLPVSKTPTKPMVPAAKPMGIPAAKSASIAPISTKAASHHST